jgi:coproporphyrinogen III oxidase-like Fe-S oxidoreductase
VSTIENLRLRNTPRIGLYLEALTKGKQPPADVEPLDDRTRLGERVMLGLRLDTPMELGAAAELVDATALDRLASLGLVECADERVVLTPRGRFLGGGVTAELLALSDPDPR